MTWVILRGRALVYLNWLRRARGRKLLRVIVLGLMGLGLAGFAYFLAVELFHAVLTLFPEFMASFIVLVFAGLTIFLLLTGVSTVLVQLYLNSDLDLLMSAPVPLSNIFVAKLIESLLVTGLPALAGLMALIAYGQASSASAVYYPFAILVLVALLTLITSVNFLVVIGVMRVVPARRAREAVTVMGAIMGAGIWALWMLFFNRSESLGQDIAALRPGAQVASENLRWAPPGWAATAVSSFVGGDWPTLAFNAGLLFAASGAMLLLTYVVFARSFYFGWLGAREAPSKAPGTRRLVSTGRRRKAVLRFLPAVDSTIVVKDWRVLSRDMRTMSRLVFPLVVVLVLSFGAFSGSDMAELPRYAQFWRVVGLVVVLLPYMFASSMALTSIATEGKAFPVLRLAPVTAAALIRAKFLSWFVPVVLFCEVVVIAAGILQGGTVKELLALGGLGVWFSAGLVMIAVASGAVAPKFEAQNPNRAVGWESSVLWLVASAIFILGSAAALGWALVLFLPINIPELAGVNPLVTFGISIVALVGLALALAALALTTIQGTGKLAKWQIAE